MEEHEMEYMEDNEQNDHRLLQSAHDQIAAIFRWHVIKGKIVPSFLPDNEEIKTFFEQEYIDTDFLNEISPTHYYLCKQWFDFAMKEISSNRDLLRITGRMLFPRSDEEKMKRWENCSLAVKVLKDKYSFINWDSIRDTQENDDEAPKNTEEKEMPDIKFPEIDITKEKLIATAYVVNEPFPEPIELGRDVIQPFLTVDSFGVKIFMCNITDAEKDAFFNQKLTAAFLPTYGIPYIIFDFGGVFMQQFSINIMKLDNAYIQNWFESDSKMVYLHLIEATTGIYLGSRLIHINMMDKIKEECKKTLSLNIPISEIDKLIKYGESLATVHEMFLQAPYKEFIPKPEINL